MIMIALLQNPVKHISLKIKVIFQFLSCILACSYSYAFKQLRNILNAMQLKSSLTRYKTLSYYCQQLDLTLPYNIPSKLIEDNKTMT